MKFTAEFKFLSPLLATCLLTSISIASFEPLPVGGRAAGMGESYSAVADDVYALYYNPAGVLQVNRPEIGSYYSQLYPGLTDNSKISRVFLGYAQPFGKNARLGGIGASYLSMELAGLYKEESLGVTYGKEYKHRWNLAGTLKLLKKSIGTDEYSSNAIDPVTGNATGNADPLLAKGRSSSALGLDLGFQYRLNQAYAAGVCIRNANNPDVGLNGSEDKAPAIYSGSLARRWRNGSIGIEVTQWKSATTNTRFSLGGEKWFKNGFGLRAGGASASRGASSFSFGASYKMESIQLDYATVLPLGGIDGTLGIQQVSLTVRLGKPPVDPIETQLVKEKESRVRAETEARYAKAEVDRLKKQLYDLTQAKTQAEQEAERRAAEFALKEAQAQQQKAEQDREVQKTTTQTRSTLSSYTAALSDYNTKVAQGITLADKKRLLEKIMNDFSGKGIDISTVIRELRSLKDEEFKAKKDFDLSMNFYRRLVQQGANTDERRGMLERIIQKYKGTGVDVSTAEDEMKLLK